MADSVIVTVPTPLIAAQGYAGQGPRCLGVAARPCRQARHVGRHARDAKTRRISRTASLTD